MQKGTDSEQTIECQLVNEHGIHIRTAAIISQICEKYDAEVTISNSRGESDGRDMMRLLMLEAAKGTTLRMTATGSQREVVLEELSAVIASGFKDNL